MHSRYLFILIGLIICLQSSFLYATDNYVTPSGYSRSDVIGLDDWGESGKDSQDIIAIYFKEDSQFVYFRVDLMNGLQNRDQNVFIAVDYTGGGNYSTFPNNGGAKTDIAWDLLLSSRSTGINTIQDVNYNYQSQYLARFTYDAQVDYLEFVVSKTAFSGWDGGHFTVQAITTQTLEGESVDTLGPVNSSASTANKRAKLILFFANLMLNNNPFSIGWYDGFTFTPEASPEEYTGSRYLLEAAQMYNLPLTLDHPIYLYPGDIYFGFDQKFHDLFDNNLLDLPDTLHYGHFLPMQPDDIDSQMLSLAKSVKQSAGLPSSTVFIPYEGMLTIGDLNTIRSSGYSAIMLHDRFHYYIDGFIEDWNDTLDTKQKIEAPRKLHKLNGVILIPSPATGNYGGYLVDDRWNDPFPSSEEKLFGGTDNGLHLWYRRTLLDLALNRDQEQFWSITADILLTPWLREDVVKNNMKWIAEHPWIETLTPTELLEKNWTPVDHGYNTAAGSTPLEKYKMEGDGHYNAYFWQHYYGGISDGHSPNIPAGTAIEGYYDYVPYLRDGHHIPSGLIMGDDQTPQSIVYKTLQNLRNAPDNKLTQLAYHLYANCIGEQAYHLGGYSGINYEFLAPFTKSKANYMGQVNKLLAAANWLAAVQTGEETLKTQVLAQDLDLDGENEYIIKNDEVFSIFENDGGVLQYLFHYGEVSGVSQIVAPIEQTILPNWGENYQQGETSITARGETAASFVEHDYMMDIYKASVGVDSLSFTSSDGKVRKTFSLHQGTVRVSYNTKVATNIRVHLPVSMTELYSDTWVENLVKITTNRKIGWKNSKGGYAFLSGGDVSSSCYATSFKDSPASQEMKERADVSTYPEGHWLQFPMNGINCYREAGTFSMALSMSQPKSIASILGLLLLK